MWARIKSGYFFIKAIDLDSYYFSQSRNLFCGRTSLDIQAVNYTFILMFLVYCLVYLDRFAIKILNATHAYFVKAMIVRN